jgi:hypothetical protein
MRVSVTGSPALPIRIAFVLVSSPSGLLRRGSRLIPKTSVVIASGHGMMRRSVAAWLATLSIVVGALAWSGSALAATNLRAALGHLP